jgi:hypothetical protein
MCTRVFVNILASPFTSGKKQLFEKMLSGIARNYRIPFLYFN